MPNSTTKETNPKDDIGARKAGLTNLSMPVLFETGVALGEGAFKYRRHNYRVYGVRASVYIDAAMRHEADWWEGEDLDPESQLSHITKAIASLTVLRDAMICGMWTDDRPPRAPAGWLHDLNAAQSRMLNRMAKANDFPHRPPHTQVEEDEKTERRGSMSGLYQMGEEGMSVPEGYAAGYPKPPKKAFDDFKAKAAGPKPPDKDWKDKALVGEGNYTRAQRGGNEAQPPEADFKAWLDQYDAQGPVG